MAQAQILIIEDEVALAAALETACRRQGLAPTLAHTGREGLAAAGRGGWAAVVLDLGLPDLGGIAVLEALRAADPAVPVLIVTAHGTLENALAARQLGVDIFLIKPVDLDDFSATLQRVVHAGAAPPPPPASTPAPTTAAAEPATETTLLIGGSPVMQRILVKIAHACASDSQVLITGPSGAGKTLAARVIHANSARRARPFVTLACGALPEPLLESELFGHEKHAFTGAAAMQTGHLERAEGGTLFLDEIGDLSPAVQLRLLRFIEERVFTRVGGRTELRLDVRLLAATHRDLRQEVAAGRFREDLYYRLHVLEIELPPLRQRREDLPMLCDYFLATLCPARPLRLADETLRLLHRHPWPGNVRELRHALEHAVAVSTGHVLLPEHLPAALRATPAAAPSEPEAALAAALGAWLNDRLDTGQPTYDTLHTELEALLLKNLWQRHEGRPSALARALDMNRTTLLKKRRLLGLEAVEEAADNET